MEKLNELVEQAKFVADWHGSDWSSALCQGKDGKQAHEIICESRGEAVISTGSNSNEASWLCDYLELCSPANILAIAEAFCALEQRAEAAEAKAKNLNDGWLNANAERDEARTEQGKLAAARSVRDNWKERAWAAEEKLAEMEKQQAVGVARMELTIGKDGLRYYQCFVDMRPDLVVAELNTGMELFTRPAPAVSLAELVLTDHSFDKWFKSVEAGDDADWKEPEYLTPRWHEYLHRRQLALGAWREVSAAILRNIEEKGTTKPAAPEVE